MWSSPRHRSLPDPGSGGRDRGPALLPTPWDRRSSDPPRVLREPPRREHRGGRLDDHAAAGEEPLHRGRTHDRPQAERSIARLAARGSPVQGGDPHAVPEHGVLRAGCLRCPGGGPDVLRRRRHRPQPGPLRPARRTDHEPRALRSVRVPEPGERTPTRGAPPDARVRDDHGGATSSRRQGADPSPPGDDLRPLPLPVLHRLPEGVVPDEPRLRRYAGGPVQAPVHRRPPDPYDPGAGRPVRRPARGRLGALVSGRPLRRRDRDGPAQRLRAGDGRRRST